MHAEFCGIEIPELNTIVIALYRPSTSGNFHNFMKNLENVLNKIFKNNTKLVLIGDFSKDFQTNSTDIQALVNLTRSFGLNAKILDYTRIKKCSATTIDNIFTDLPDECCSSGVIEPGLSDHSGQYLCILSKTVNVESKNNYFSTRHINKSGLFQLKEHLKLIDWSYKESTSNDVNTFADYLVHTYKSLIELCFPLQKATNSASGVMWFNNELKVMRDSVIALKIVSNSSKDIVDKNAYLKARYL
ncbi:hypothetical protein Zmor_011253 [Zophobas morio]|uniref:Endonuclease/exonuclease/phosphatase domain-containing protein n=1 Tax=Zophobas morio TaxID=2755281 RepID=A0AA38MJC9_9CUCU|nr:hypothetical protein Zmor_011253 [Zophobas morio]